MIWDRRVVGAVQVSAPSSPYDAEDLKTLTVAGGQLGRAVTYAQERTQRSNDQRLTAIGRMLASVAHDLRTPMTVISGHAQLMIEEEDPRQRIERCSRILGQIEEMVAMIGDLLAFARGDSSVRRSHVEVDALAAEMQQSIMPLCAPRGIALQLDASRGVAIVDLGRTKRIIHNLAKNAIDVMTRGAHLHIALTAEQQGLHILVRDQGKGMDEATQARLFEPFFTDKSDGTGLGLTIVKRFVDDHGGSIRVKSAEGSGTTVEVLLPHAARSENDTL
jgi:signal transduction histidine kinase